MSEMRAFIAEIIIARAVVACLSFGILALSRLRCLFSDKTLTGSYRVDYGSWTLDCSTLHCLGYESGRMVNTNRRPRFPTHTGIHVVRWQQNLKVFIQRKVPLSPRLHTAWLCVAHNIRKTGDVCWALVSQQCTTEHCPQLLPLSIAEELPTWSSAQRKY